MEAAATQPSSHALLTTDYLLANSLTHHTTTQRRMAWLRKHCHRHHSIDRPVFDICTGACAARTSLLDSAGRLFRIHRRCIRTAFPNPIQHDVQAQLQRFKPLQRYRLPRYRGLPACVSCDRYSSQSSAKHVMLRPAMARPNVWPRARKKTNRSHGSEQTATRSLALHAPRGLSTQCNCCS